MVTREDPPQGIAGFLVLVAIGVIIAPFEILRDMVLVFSPIFTEGIWAVLTDPSSADYVPFIELLVVPAHLINLALAAFGFILIILFFRKSARFPKLFIMFMLLRVAVTFLNGWLGSLVTPDKPIFDSDTASGLTRQILVCLIWIPYIIASERVAATFTRSRHVPVLQPEQFDPSSS